MKETKQGSGGFLIGMALGTLVGAAIYYFLDDTSPGKKTVKKIGDGAQDAITGLKEIVQDIDGEKDQIAQKTEKIGREIEEKISQAKQEIAQEVEKSLDQIEKLQSRGRKFVRFFTKGGRPVNKIS